MKRIIPFILVVTFIVFNRKGIAQTHSAYLQIKFEIPNLAYIPLVDWENYEQMSRTQRIDDEGYLKVSVPIERSQVVFINYLDSANKIHIHPFFLPKSDTLRCVEQQGKFTFEGKGKAAKINQFLYKIGILGEDTLGHKPLMRKVSEEIYANFMRDIADEKWQLYQTTQDTTDATQNIFVKAALEAQQYQRVQFFLETKDWTDDMFDKSKGNGRFVMPNYEITYRPPFRIIQHEDALVSRDYQFALISYLGGNIYFMRPKGSLSEKIGIFYDAIDRELGSLPKTRETLLSTILRNNWFNDEGSQALLERFERDFPNSKHIKQVRYSSWTMQKLKVGNSIPPVPLLKMDSTQSELLISKGMPTFVLIWNTWEDSCQIALSLIAALANKYNKNEIRFMTIGVRNRFDSWKEVLKCHWPNPQKEAHFYADYPETSVLEGIFTRRRPMLIVLDKEGKFVEQMSPFEKEKIEKWLKR